MLLIKYWLEENKMAITDIVVLTYSHNTTNDERSRIYGFSQKLDAVGLIKPIPKNWGLEGDEAYSFYNRANAAQFLRYAYSYFNLKAINSATIISNVEFWS